MNNQYIIGVIDKKGVIYSYNFDSKNESIDLKEIKLGEEYLFDNVTIVPYGLPNSFIKLPQGYKYIILNADVDITNDEYNNLNPNNRDSYIFKNRKVIPYYVEDELMLKIDKSIIKECFYDFHRWYLLYTVSEKEVIKLLDLYEEILYSKKNQSYYSIMFYINNNTINNLDIILKYLNHWKKNNLLSNISFRLEYYTLDEKITQESINDTIKTIKDLNLNSEDIYMLLNNLFVMKTDDFLIKSLINEFLTEEIIIKSFQSDKELKSIYLYLCNNNSIIKNFNADNILKEMFDNKLLNINDLQFNLFLKKQYYENDIYDLYSQDDLIYKSYEESPFFSEDVIYKSYDEYRQQANLILIVKPYLSKKSDYILDKISQVFIDYVVNNESLNN